MNHVRRKLRCHVDFLADAFRRDCPFAAAVLRVLGDAMEADADRELADAAIGWMVAGLADAALGLAGEARERGLSIDEILAWNRDPLPIVPVRLDQN